MGFWGSFFTKKSKDEGSSTFLNADEFAKNLALQIKMSPQTLIQLRKYGVNDDTNLKLEFFFYTDAKNKAQALATRLRSLGYDLEREPCSADDGKLLVTGWTTPQNMSEKAVVAWTEKMCQLGYEWDCEFDGWGTNPKQ